MASLPGLVSLLSQDPRNRIIKVAWAPLGGMLFLYFSWVVNGNDPLLPTGDAIFSGLPSEFHDIGNVFSGPWQATDRDPNIKVDPKANTGEPITDAALAKFLYWTAAVPILSRDAVTPPDTIVYFANDGSADGVDADTAFENYPPGAQTYCGTPATRVSNAGSGWFECHPERIAEVNANGYPDVGENDGYSGDQARVARFCAALNWFFSQHVPEHDRVHVSALNLGHTPTENSLKNYAVLTLNINKLRKYQPKGLNGKKPNTMTFTVTANDFPGDKQKKTRGDWNVSGYLVSAKLPPKGTGVRRFPLDSDTLEPKFQSSSFASADFTNPKDGARVDITIDFVNFELTMATRGTTSPPKEG